MTQNIAGLRKAFEDGKFGRRELMRALGLGAGVVLAAGVAPELSTRSTAWYSSSR